MSFSVEIDPEEVVCRSFLGFGAEWDSRGYDAAGVGDSDFAVVRRRLEWMRLPVARIMMQAKWCYKGGDRYDWQGPEMRALYRHLDLCQRIGTVVFLVDWGCEPKWLNAPGIRDVADPKYAEVIGTYMNHLVVRKRYTCIRYFIMVNEPNYEVKDWNRWKTGVGNVFAEFRRRGLHRKVTFTGSDHSNNDRWHEMAVDQLQDVLGAYDVHRYANDRDVRRGKLYDYFRRSWQYALDGDPRAAGKPFVVGEAGMNDGAEHPRGNRNIDTAYYGIFMADYACQAANAGSAAVLAWMLDDNSHPGFFWGMWTSKEKGLKLRPWFYPWSLLGRCFPAGCRIHGTGRPAGDVRVLAASLPRSGRGGGTDWSLCVVNRGTKPVVAALRVRAGGRIRLYTYVFNERLAKADRFGFPQPVDAQVCDLKAGARIACDGETVVVATSLRR